MYYQLCSYCELTLLSEIAPCCLLLGVDMRVVVDLFDSLLVSLVLCVHGYKYFLLTPFDVVLLPLL
jgi:hypothetical protein